jgi:hypothetical protein
LKKNRSATIRAIDARGADLVPRHMQLKKAKVLAGRGVRRAAEENCEVPDVTDVILLDLLLEMTDRHVLDHALAQGADVVVDHGDAPVSHEVANRMILRRDELSRWLNSH